MRTHVWAAALAVALGLAWRPAAAQTITTGPAASSQSSSPSVFGFLRFPSFLFTPGKFADVIPSIPSIDHTQGYTGTSVIPLTNGKPNADYFKLFGMQRAQRLH